MRSQIVTGLIILSSCGSVKKLVTHQDIKTDSVGVTVHDTTSTAVELVDQRDLDLKDLDITIEYSDSSIKNPITHFSQPQIQTLHNVIESVSGGRVPKMVTIHVGSFSDSGRSVTSSVTVSGHTSDSSHLKKAETILTRDVSKKTIPVWLIITGSLVGIVLLAIGAIKLYKKFIPLAIILFLYQTTHAGTYSIVSYFGAKAGGFVNAAIFAKAATFAIANPGTTISFPVGDYYTSKPWIFQKVVDGKWQFFTVRIVGATDAQSPAQGYGSNIIYTGKTGFAIGIQFGRGILIENMGVYGAYHFPDGITNQTIGTTSYSTWSDGSVEDGQHHPYAGICIDPFCDSSYLTDGYTGMRSEYLANGQRGGTSGMQIKHCGIHNFMVGVMLTPNPATQNDEDVYIDYDNVDACKVAIAIGQDQSKAITIAHFKCWASTHTVLDGMHYGQGTGGGSVFCENWNIAGNVGQLFNLRTDRFPLSASRIFAESLFRIGSVGGGAGANFNDCQIDFLMGDGIPAPGYILSGTANFHGGSLRYYDNNDHHRMNFVGTTKGQATKFSDMTLGTPPITCGIYGWESNFYPTPIFDNVRNYSTAKCIQSNYDTLIKLPIAVSIISDTVKWTATASAPGLSNYVQVGDYILFGSGWSYYKDNPVPYGTLQFGRIISISGDSAVLNDVGVNAWSGTTSVYISRLK